MNTLVRNFPSPSRCIKEITVFLVVQMLVVAPNFAGIFKRTKSIAKDIPPRVQLSDGDVLKYSHIAYRAMGGYSGVQSYSVLITCIEGRISVLKTIHDNRIRSAKKSVRHRGKMSSNEYLNLWKSLQKQNVFNTQNAPEPALDIHDEFTYHFDFQVGGIKNDFEIYGLNRPQGSRYFVFKSMIDKASDMTSLWNKHIGLAKK